jgi:hypothetical protein
MAASFTCDGCGVNVEQPKVVGSVIKRDYCEVCAKNAESFLAAEEDNRAHFCLRFGEIRQQLINVHGKDGKFKLPDVP